MRTRIPLAFLLFAFSALCLAQTKAASQKQMTTKTQTPEEGNRSAIIVDTHADTPQRFVDEHFDLSDPLNGGNLNLDSIHKGNLGAEFFSIWVEPTPWS